MSLPKDDAFSFRNGVLEPAGMDALPDILWSCPLPEDRAVHRDRLPGRGRAETGSGPVETARLPRLAEESAVKARTRAINQLKAVLVVADPQLWSSLEGLGPKTLIHRCAELQTNLTAF